jgi:uncharacterized protein YjbI with pentapeptide repeats
MAEKPHLSWKKARKSLEIVGIIIVGMLVTALVVVIILAYVFNMNVPGLHGKTLWDWLQLLIIPAVLAVGGYLFNYTITRAEQRNTQVRDQNEQAIALDNQRESALQGYIDNMSGLLLHEKLRESGEDDEVRKIARVRTLSVLPRLDKERKRSVLQFLYESNLIADGQSIIDLKGADLSEANLRGIDLQGADLAESILTKTDLREANLEQANLRAADLRNARMDEIDFQYRTGVVAVYLHAGSTRLSKTILSGADLRGADLRGADFREADLSWAQLDRADLSSASLANAILGRASLVETNLRGAFLENANLNGANLNRADLRDAWLVSTSLTGSGFEVPDEAFYDPLKERLNSGANLEGTNLDGANLEGADLSGAYLKDAIVSLEELKKAKSLQDATMP